MYNTPAQGDRPTRPRSLPLRNPHRPLGLDGSAPHAALSFGASAFAPPHHLRPLDASTRTCSLMILTHNYALVALSSPPPPRPRRCTRLSACHRLTLAPGPPARLPVTRSLALFPVGSPHRLRRCGRASACSRSPRDRGQLRIWLVALGSPRRRQLDLAAFLPPSTTYIARSPFSLVPPQRSAPDVQQQHPLGPPPPVRRGPGARLAARCRAREPPAAGRRRPLARRATQERSVPSLVPLCRRA